jgi:hypothetical protein
MPSAKVHSCTVTVTADEKSRVTLPAARPGDKFEVHVAGEGQMVLTRVLPVQGDFVEVKIEKRGNFSVGVLSRPIDDQALKEALADFP